jgi:DNA-binding Lrp family transcriptional regulator
MIEFNNIRIALGLSWNEFYLCFLVQFLTKTEEYCTMTRNDMAANLGVSKQATIDLVKKLDQSGYIVNAGGRLKCSDQWSRNFTKASEFTQQDGKETLPSFTIDGKETLPESTDAVKKVDRYTNVSGKETLPEDCLSVKKLYHLQKNSGKETLPIKTGAVKNLYQQERENVEQNQEPVKKLDQDGKETLPHAASGDLYIDTKEVSINKKDLTEVEKGCGEKQKPYDLIFKDEVATCKVLQAACKKYHEDHPEKYSLDMYSKFIRHWSTPDRKGVPKWYRELNSKRGTWHLPGRLVTWHENDLKFNSKSSNGKSNTRSGSTLRPTSIAEPSKRSGSGNVAHVEF